MWPCETWCPHLTDEEKTMREGERKHTYNHEAPERSTGEKQEGLGLNHCGGCVRVPRQGRSWRGAAGRAAEASLGTFSQHHQGCTMALKETESRIYLDRAFLSPIPEVWSYFYIEVDLFIIKIKPSRSDQKKVFLSNVIRKITKFIPGFIQGKGEANIAGLQGQSWKRIKLLSGCH